VRAPVEPALRRDVHLHLQLTSPRRAAEKLKYLAGSEAAMGAFISDTTPESVAERLRELAGTSAAGRLRCRKRRSTATPARNRS